VYSRYRYDAGQNILYMEAVAPVVFNTEEELNRLYTELLDQIKSLPAKPYMAVDLSGYTVSPRVANYHGEWMLNRILPAVLSFTRYGTPTPLNEISLRTQAVRRNYEVVIHPDRAAALATIFKLKRAIPRH
jgi:hypothetical protein